MSTTLTCTRNNYNILPHKQIKNLFLDPGRFRGRFLRKVLRKVIPERKWILRKVLAEGFSGRFRGRLFFFLPHKQILFLRKVPRKVSAEGSVEGFCGRFCGRFLRKVSRKVL